jgi:hypothetical protein
MHKFFFAMAALMLTSLAVHAGDAPQDSTKCYSASEMHYADMKYSAGQVNYKTWEGIQFLSPSIEVRENRTNDQWYFCYPASGYVVNLLYVLRPKAQHNLIANEK